MPLARRALLTAMIYAPDFARPGSQSRPDFCGWTGLGPLAIGREYIA